MNTMRMLGLVLASSLVVGCGGSDTPAPAAPAPAPVAPEAEAHEGHETQEGHEGEEAHEHNFPAEVTAFHDVLSPNWHAEPGDERTEATCRAIGDMRARAVAITAAAAPAGVDATAWSEAASGLVSSVDALGVACNAKGRPDFDATFTALHDQFHVLVELVGHEEKH